MSLPKVFANKIDKKIDNNIEFFHGDRSVKKKDISDLRVYFDKNGYTNKLLLDITTKDGVSSEKIILYRNGYLVNIDNKKIYFEDILDYDIKK